MNVHPTIIWVLLWLFFRFGKPFCLPQVEPQKWPTRNKFALPFTYRKKKLMWTLRCSYIQENVRKYNWHLLYKILTHLSTSRWWIGWSFDFLSGGISRKSVSPTPPPRPPLDPSCNTVSRLGIVRWFINFSCEIRIILLWLLTLLFLEALKPKSFPFHWWTGLKHITT